MKLASKLLMLMGIILLVMVGLMAINGLTLMILWTWFIKPLGVVGINIFWAAGIIAIIAFLQFRDNSEVGEIGKAAKTSNPDQAFSWAIAFLWGRTVTCCLALGVGFVLHLLM